MLPLTSIPTPHLLPLPPRPPLLQCFWLFLIFYGMPAQLEAFKVPSQCDYLETVPGYCCYAGGSPSCIQPAGNWLASECW